MYGNDNYPHSRRIWSRPFSGFHHRDDAPDRAVMKLREALHEIGKELIGEPFHPCCDLGYEDPRAPRWFSPSSWRERDVTQNADVARAYARTLPADAGPALLAVVDQIVRGEATEPVPGKSNHIRRVHPHDVPRLLVDIQNFWHGSLLDDARVTHAEELFFYTADTAASSMYHYDREPQRLAATLAWMARPANADRVARGFLYSRLAQHFGETNGVGLTVAKKVSAELDNGGVYNVIATLRESPDDYVFGAQDTSSGVLGRLFARGAAAQRHDILNRESLADTAERITDDYHRLKSGKWAARQLEMLSPPRREATLG